MRDWSLASLAGLGSAALLAGALFFQYVVGLAPCELCILQRWPHLVAFILGVIVWFFPAVWIMGLGALAAATASGLGVYHTGVERGWWQGPTTCSGSGDITQLSPQQLLDQILAAPVVRCTDVAWEMFGLSMASWNAILSLGLAGLWLLAMRQRA
ncbi:MAG: disulfide bond formation protein B [Rhodobacter sp.]|nr:disulfide bond formation protein B [Paracoccaceae bacterium]MCC0079952.1 disulfide bond formation protein B [Rhodobacter sp.]